MVIAREYSVRYEEQEKGYRVLCWETHSCPVCRSPLSGYDSRRRTAVDSSGNTSIYILRRLRCAGCGRLHTEIPLFLIPHKHYERKVIENALSGAKSNNCPAESSTIKRWKK